MAFRYSLARIHEIVTAPKAVSEGHAVFPPKKKGSNGLSFRTDLDLIDGGFMDLQFYGKAGISDVPESYDSTLMIEKQRVRGIGYNATERKNLKSKVSIPKGWHENVVDPNRSSKDPAYNRHEAMPDFQPKEFEDFTRKVAEKWNIDLQWETVLL